MVTRAVVNCEDLPLAVPVVSPAAARRSWEDADVACGKAGASSIPDIARPISKADGRLTHPVAN